MTTTADPALGAPALPAATEAERYILAALMLDATCAPLVRQYLEPRHFYLVPHQHVYAALLTLCERHPEADSVTVIMLVTELTERCQIELVGGLPALSTLLDYATTSANVKIHAQLVLDAYNRRQAMRLARAIHAEAASPGVVISEVMARAGKAAQELSLRSALDRRAWLAEVRDGRQMLEEVFPPVHSIVGTGALVRGSYAMIAGHAGLGKTYLTLQLVSSILSGAPFFGLPTAPGRIGLLEFEMPWAALQERLRALDDGFADHARGLDALCMPEGRWTLCERDTIERVVDWCGERSLVMAILDPVNRLRRGDENSPEVASETLEAIHEIRQRTGTCILPVFHVRKIPAAGAATTRGSILALDSIKGPSRYTDDADTVILMDEIVDGGERLVWLGWPKTRLGARVNPAFLRRLPSGFFAQVEPSAVKRETADLLLASLLHAAGVRGIGIQDAVEALHVTANTARSALERVGAASVGAGRARRYVHPDFGPPGTTQGEPEEELF